MSILKTVDMETSANFNYGHEGKTVEFKTSFIVSAGKHDKDQQFVVFRAACAMANTEGGVIYIGVDDSGKVATGPHYGVRGDIEKMPRMCTNDAYVRYINQKISAYFFDKNYVRGIITAEETDNSNVVRIDVKKADRVVYLHENGACERLAFRREGPSSQRMTNTMIAQKEHDLAAEKSKGATIKKEEEIKIRINEAIARKQKLMIYGYNSSNSDTKTDRLVEPISLICDGRFLWAYEEKNEANDPLRQFKISRIENVKILDQTCDHEESYKPAFTDAFEWSRATTPSVHISILVGPAAKNRLVEECPGAKKYLFDSGDGQWTLDADVHSLIPVKRFCQEFRDSITVYVPEELKKELGLMEQQADNESASTDDKSVEEMRLVERIKMAMNIICPNLFKRNIEYAGGVFNQVCWANIECYTSFK